jgi:agmatinase
MASFPGANTARDDADYVLVGAPLDASTSFQPGTRFGPDRVRRYARGFEDYDHATGTHFSELGVADHGDVRAWDDAADYLEYLASVCVDVQREGSTPLLVGGEHTVSVAGVRAVDPDVFVCLDAHLDLKAEFDGNPLSHATVTRHALDVADRAVVLGARAGSEAEYERATEADVTVVEPADVPDYDPAFDADDVVYCSVDVDAADPAYAPGTGTPEPFGLDAVTMRRVVRDVAATGQVAGFDVVEVNDRDDGQAAVLAAKLLRAFVHADASTSQSAD